MTASGGPAWPISLGTPLLYRFEGSGFDNSILHRTAKASPTKTFAAVLSCAAQSKSSAGKDPARRLTVGRSRAAHLTPAQRVAGLDRYPASSPALLLGGPAPDTVPLASRQGICHAFSAHRAATAHFFGGINLRPGRWPEGRFRKEKLRIFSPASPQRHPAQRGGGEQRIPRQRSQRLEYFIDHRAGRPGMTTRRPPLCTVLAALAGQPVRNVRRERTDRAHLLPPVAYVTRVQSDHDKNRRIAAAFD